MEKLGIVTVALVPCLLFFSILVYFSRNTRVPVSYREIVVCVILGLLSVFPVGLWTWVVGHWRTSFAHQVAYGFYESFLLAAIPEELCRYLILRWRLGRLPQPIDLKICLLLGCVTGLSFGAFEHVVFCFYEGWQSCWQRLLVNVPYHTFAGAIIGYFVGYALMKRRETWAFVGLAVTIVLHGINNFNLRRLFEDVALLDQGEQVAERTPGWLEQILVTHWPSNILVTSLTTMLAIFLFRKVKQIK